MNDNLISSLKPSERVRQYLDKKGKSWEIGPGHRLPTADELGELLKVSAGTVKNVYRELAKEGRVKTLVGVGSFWLADTTPALGSYPKSYRVGILSDIPKGGEARLSQTVWRGAIFGGILNRQLQHGPGITLELCPVGTDLLPREESGFDGFIDLTIRGRPHTFLEKESPIVVHLNPPYDQATTNFAAPDYSVCSRVLGEAWRKSGRKRILFLHAVPLSKTASGRLRYGGLLCGLGERVGSDIEVRSLVVSRSPCATAGSDLVQMIEETGWTPDAVYCIGDVAGREVVNALTARGFSIPAEVSVVGGCLTELASIGHQPLTCMAHPLEAVGEALFDLLKLRLQRGGKAVPGVFKPVPFSLGATTRPDENEMLAHYSRGIVAGIERPVGDLL